jgi:hypothetical protein
VTGSPHCTFIEEARVRMEVILSYSPSLNLGAFKIEQLERRRRAEKARIRVNIGMVK